MGTWYLKTKAVSLYYIDNIYFYKASEFYTGFLGAFSKFPKRLLISSWLSFCLSLLLSVGPSVRPSLKSDRITSTVHEDQCKFVIISCSVLLRIKMFQTNIVEKIKTQFIFNNFVFRKSWRLWDNVGKYRTSRQATDVSTVRLMSIACWIPKAINTQSQDVISIAFPLQHWLHERTSVLCYSILLIL